MEEMGRIHFSGKCIRPHLSRRLIMRITLGLALWIETMTQGAEIMGQVVPIVIHLMMNDHQRVWGDACYPVVE
jgi:hypothetical protein